MWKLTITQKRKSEYSNYPTSDHVEFLSDDIHELVQIVDRMNGLEADVLETSFKIEKVAKEGEGNGI